MKLLNIIAALSLVLFVGCGGGSSNKKQAESSQESSGQKEQMASNDNVRTINIIGVDQMRFAVEKDEDGISVGDPVGNENLPELQSITVKPGEKIRIRLSTHSKLPATAMSHNWVLLKNSADPEAFDNAASKAKDNDYIPSDMTDQIIAHVPLTSGGETHEVTFTAPEQTGDYTYLCSFPGHFASGMKGVLKVENSESTSM
ncbi:MAG TPA: plastocyanin/azurin family copper-binding protein [Balneolaceae bacterium]|nr:plastocyanin/azurin family copper-binding protein [Balneolaceae bacterium]